MNFPKICSILAPAMLALIFVSCNESDPKERPLPNQHTMQIDASSYERWAYFSFAVGDTIPAPADPSTSLEWDLAFHKWDIRTNSGASGVGRGGACRATAELAALIDPDVVPREVLFVEDGTIRTFMAMPVMGRPPFDPTAFEEQKVEVAGSATLGGWIDIDFSGMPPRVSFEPSLWWVRRADGSYAVVQFTHYMDDKGTEYEFYPTFNYWLK